MIETWLYDGEIVNSLWNVYRADRVSTSNIIRRDGGVLIAVKNNMNCVQIVNSSIDTIDFVIVTLKPYSKMINLNATYIPPNLVKFIYVKLMKYLKKPVILMT